MKNINNFLKDQDYSFIIWDFNGTILNDSDLNLEATNKILEKRQRQKIELSTYRENICFPVSEFYKKLNLDLDQEAIDSWVKYYRKHYLKQPLGNGVINLLSHFQNEGKKQFVLSALQQDMLREATTHLKIDHYFQDIRGVKSYDGPSKIQEGHDLIKDHGPFSKHAGLFIGDTLHDLEVANAIGIDCLLVSHGHQCPKVLRNKHSFVIDSFLDLFAH